MRTTFAAASFVAVAAVARLARAEVNDDIRHANNAVGLSVVARHVSYAESNMGMAGIPDPADTEKGWLPGGRVDVAVETPIAGSTDILLGASFEVLPGSLTYDGGIQSQNAQGQFTYTPAQLTSDAKMYELALFAGVPIPIGDTVSLAPMVRYRFREWDRTLAPGQPGSYDETYTHHELGAGVLLQVALGGGFVLGGDASIGTLVSPSLAAKLPGSTVSLDFSLGAKPVFVGGVSADYALGRIHLRLGYELHAFAFGASPIKDFGGVTLREPSSTTTEHEVRLGAAYGF